LYVLPCRVFKKCIQMKGKVFIMRKKVEMSRLSLRIPTALYRRIDEDSRRYDITKTALIQTMMVNYYRSVDSSSFGKTPDCNT